MFLRFVELVSGVTTLEHDARQPWHLVALAMFLAAIAAVSVFIFKNPPLKTAEDVRSAESDRAAQQADECAKTSSELAVRRLIEQGRTPDERAVIMITALELIRCRKLYGVPPTPNETR